MIRDDFYYIISTKGDITSEDYDSIKKTINSYKGVAIHENKEDQNKAGIFFEGKSFTAEFEYGNFPIKTEKKFHISENKIKVTCDTDDWFTPDMLRAAAVKNSMRIYSVKLDSLIPNVSKVIYAVPYSYKKEYMEVYKKAGISPIYHLADTATYYGKKENSPEVYIINPNLMTYFATTNQFEDTDELYYKVADNLEEFAAKFDAKLLPLDFYEYYKRPFKIINESNFDINNPGRKVFIKPYILELKNEDSTFYTLPGAQGSLLYMTKIIKGETLDMSIKRFLNEDLKITNDYIGAYVSKVIDYDRDRENKLTPRLVVSVFLEEGVIPSQIKDQAQKGWTPVPKS